MRFSTRTFLFSSAPTIALLVAAFYFVENLTISALTNDARHSLRQSQLAMARSHARAEAESARLLKIVAENAPLKAVMQLMAIERNSPEAQRTLEEQLGDIGAALDLGFLSVAYPDGRFMAGMIRTPAGWTPLQPGHLVTLSSGYVSSDGAVYTVTANRVSQAGEDLGVVSVGRTFELADIETAAVLVNRGRVLLSAAPGIPNLEIERGLKTCGSQPDCQLRLANANYLLTRLDGSWNGDGCALISLENLDAATGPAAARLRSIFLSAGIGVLLFALLGSLLSARAIVQPLALVVSRLRASEKSGDLSEISPGSGAVREIRELTEDFNRAAAAIRRTKADLERAYVQFAGSLASALDARDSYTAGHSARVSQYSCAIAAAIGIPGEEIAQIRIGALLHDIGKIGIVDSVLHKTGRLTGEEFAVIQQHPTIGLRILEGVNGFQPYLAIVELHHENWDGTGYPRGLGAEDVPLPARIVHVADAFDAMTSDRPYRRGMSAGEAMSILRRFAGTQFDPTVVDAFLSRGLATPGLASLLQNIGFQTSVELKTA